MKRIPTRTCALTIGAILSVSLANLAAANSFTLAPDISGGFGNYKWDIGIDSAAAVGNPSLYLARGQIYTFNVNTTAIHPFWIKTAVSTSSANAYTGGGLSANGVTTNTAVTFDVPLDAPDTLFYDCGNHLEMHATIHVVIFKDGFD